MVGQRGEKNKKLGYVLVYWCEVNLNIYRHHNRNSVSKLRKITVKPYMF